MPIQGRRNADVAQVEVEAVPETGLCNLTAAYGLPTSRCLCRTGRGSRWRRSQVRGGQRL